MKRIITAGLLGAGITVSLLGAGAANAVPNEYANQTPDQLVQLALQRTASLPSGQIKGLQAAHQAFVAGDDTTAKKILVDIVDGPQWAADPALEALAQVLPKKLGGGTNGDSYTPTPGGTNGGGRDEADGTLMAARNAAVSPGGIRNNAEDRVKAHEANAAKVRDAIKGALAPKK